MNQGIRALCYTRVSTSEQAESGAGLAAQRTAVLGEVERRGWTLVELVEDAGHSSATLDRPGISAVLARLDRNEADALVVAKLDRLTRSIKDFGDLADRARRKKWAIVALDLGVDMTTPAGELVASVVAGTAQYERRIIGQRTKEALAARRAAGVRLGRPMRTPSETVRRIVDDRANGLTLKAIAEGLTADGIPTVHGGLWHPATVRAVLISQNARAMEQDPPPLNAVDKEAGPDRAGSPHCSAPDSGPQDSGRRRT
jgi:DNA invertase Pin-like site-specific DNA recombinase